MRKKLIREIVKAQRKKKGLRLFYKDNEGKNVVRMFHGRGLSFLFQSVANCTNKHCRVMREIKGIKEIIGWQTM